MNEPEDVDWRLADENENVSGLEVRATDELPMQRDVGNFFIGKGFRVQSVTKAPRIPGGYELWLVSVRADSRDTVALLEQFKDSLRTLSREVEKRERRPIETAEWNIAAWSTAQSVILSFEWADGWPGRIKPSADGWGQPELMTDLASAERLLNADEFDAIEHHLQQSLELRVADIMRLMAEIRQRRNDVEN